ncbi:hypothetical protein J6590_105789, partial [Homalodisca vitripennis]
VNLSVGLGFDAPFLILAGRTVPLWVSMPSDSSAEMPMDPETANKATLTNGKKDEIVKTKNPIVTTSDLWSDR